MSHPNPPPPPNDAELVASLKVMLTSMRTLTVSSNLSRSEVDAAVMNGNAALNTILATDATPLSMSPEALEILKEMGILVATVPRSLEDVNSHATKTDELDSSVMDPPKQERDEKARPVNYTTSEQEMIAQKAQLPSVLPILDSNTNGASTKGSDAPPAIKQTSEDRKDFPTEIWTQIWELVANNNPRNVDVWAWSTDRDPKPALNLQSFRGIYVNRFEPFKFMTTQIVPPILHVNALSRNIGLRYYKLSFGISIATPGGQYNIEPRIYRHIHNDCICPMGRFDNNNSITAFWKALPEGAPALALNLYVLLSSDEKKWSDIEIAHDEFGDEDFRGHNLDLVPISSFMLPNHRTPLVEKIMERIPNIYLYNFTDYFSKQGPRDFRFTPYVEDPNNRAPLALHHGGGDPVLRIGSFLKQAATFVLPTTDAYVYLYSKWQRWLIYGGYKWTKGKGPKPTGGGIDNAASPEIQERNKFFALLKPWEEEQFIKRGDTKSEIGL